MGSFYDNVVVKGLTQEQIVAYLREHQQHAFVSPTVNEITFVYDQDWGASAEVLSRSFGCVALIEAVHDSDIFTYKLYDHGQLIDEYDSRPDYFDGDYYEGDVWTGPEDVEHDGPHQPEPTGGDAHVLCTALGVEHLTAQVDALLHPPVSGSIAQLWVFADDHHSTLANVLGWPASAWRADFRYLAQEGPEDLIKEFNGGEVIRTP